MRFLIGKHVAIVGVLLIMGCQSGDADLREISGELSRNLKEYRVALEMVRLDRGAYGISHISAKNADRTYCGEGALRKKCSLPVERWAAYSRQLKSLGILWIDVEGSGDRVYFALRYNEAFTSARILGVVHSDGYTDFSNLLPRQKWTAVGEGWSVFDMSDG